MLPLQPPSFADTAVGVRPTARDGRREPREAFDPKWVTGPVEEDKSSGETAEDEEDRDDPTASVTLAPVDAPADPARLPREVAEGAPYPSGSADRAPSPPAADPLFGSVSSLAVHVEAADIDVLPPIGQAVLDGEALGGTFSAAPTDGGEGSWTPLVPDRPEPGEAQRFMPLGAAGRPLGPPRPLAPEAPEAPRAPAVALPKAAAAPVDARLPPTPDTRPATGGPEPVLEPLERELARLVLAATAVRAGPPAHGGRLRSPAPTAPTAPAAEAAPEGPSTAAPAATPAAATTPDGPSPGQAPEVGAAPQPAANAVRAALPREPAPPAGPPQREEPLPPPSTLPHTRLRIDRELSVEVSSHGHRVDVSLHGSPDALDPLRDIGPELGDSLASSGFSLGQFLTQDQDPEQEGAPGQAGDPTQPGAAPRPARQDGSRIRRYA